MPAILSALWPMLASLIWGSLRRMLLNSAVVDEILIQGLDWWSSSTVNVRDDKVEAAMKKALEQP